MSYFNDWHDYLSVFLLIASLWCSYTLIQRYRSYNDDWTGKTRDYWYALLMWTFVGVTGAIQHIILDRPVTPGFVSTVAAVVVTGTGLMKKGSWGGEDA